MVGKDVQLTASDGGKFSAYLVASGAKSAPVIVVLQEIFGVNANIRAIADDFAEAGFIAIAPDLFWRQQPGVQLDPKSEDDRKIATDLLKGMNAELAVEDSLVALRHALNHPDSNGRAASVGYCMGGKIAYLLATKFPMDASISYYGVGIQGLLDLAPKVQGQLLLHIAGEDHLCPPEAQAAIIAAMAPYADRIKVETYPGAGHAFARRGGATFNAGVAERANAASSALLSALKSGTR